MTGEKLIRQILLQTKNRPHGQASGGWVAVRVPGVSDRDLSLYIRDASDRGLLKAVSVSHLTSPHDEWRIIDITASGLQFLEDTKPSKKLRLLVWAGIVGLLGFLGWLIPVLISLWKR
jgi:hypothetical protein